jgi:hypothetical protein
MLITFVYVSCSTLKQKVDGIDPELEDPLAMVYLVSNGTLSRTIKHVGFFKEETEEEDGYKVIGTCSWFTNWDNIALIPQIQLHRETWGRYTNTQKIILLAHELYHCECDGDHKDEYFEDGCQAHYMHSYMPSKSCINDHWEEYSKQIKKGCSE